MAKSVVVWQGLEEYRTVLRALPEELRGETDHYVEDAANSAAVDIRSAYPARTGNLSDGVEVFEKPAGPFGTARVVINRAPHAVIFEHGTQARHTKLGAFRGSMPPGHVFIPRVIKWRQRFIEQVKDLLQRHGAVVIDDAGQ